MMTTQRRAAETAIREDGNLFTGSIEQAEIHLDREAAEPFDLYPCPGNRSSLARDPDRAEANRNVGRASLRAGKPVKQCNKAMEGGIYREWIEVVADIRMRRFCRFSEFNVDNVIAQSHSSRQKLEARPILQAEAFGCFINLNRREAITAFGRCRDFNLMDFFIHRSPTTADSMNGPVITAQPFAGADLDITGFRRKKRRKLQHPIWA
ncbi:hypothetical protein D3C87_1383040 [compost metagenome]